MTISPAPQTPRLDGQADLGVLSDQVAARTVTTVQPDGEGWREQSLTGGAAGIALLHIERAHHGSGAWADAHAWIQRAAAGQVNGADHAGLFLGLPAIGFMLHAAAAGTGRYRTGLADTVPHLASLAHQRLETAEQRIRAGAPGGFREYDVFFGLTGIGALLARIDPGGGALERTLSYLVALTRPLHLEGRDVPGWWAGHDPHRRTSPAFPGGHLNLGTAHGITGPLALLALTHRDGITVPGQGDAIRRILAFLNEWRQDSDTGPWWPQWLSLPDLIARRPAQTGPGRPSWCYGTPGIARAAQLASLAVGDPTEQARYEDALGQCLSDPAQTGRIIDGGLCHGAAGLYQTCWRTARDATTPALTAHLPRLAALLAHHALGGSGREDGGPGFLDGAAGTALALHTAAYDQAPASGWDACLLLT